MPSSLLGVGNRAVSRTTALPLEKVLWTKNQEIVRAGAGGGVANLFAVVREAVTR